MFSFFDKNFQNITVEDFKELKKKRDTVILDVRSRGEQMGGVINGQRNLNVMAKDFKEKAAKLDKSKTYVCYCQSGIRSKKACRIMGKLGVENIYNLKGGYNAWDREVN